MGSRWFLFIYFSPEGSVTSPPTQTSQALLAAGGTEQESARLVKKKKKTGGNWRWSGEDEGRYSVWATFVHYRLLRGAARERRPHDGVRKRLGRAVPCESRHTHLCHLVFRCEVTDQRSTDWLKLDWEVWTSSNFFCLFFAASSRRRVQIHLLMSAWLHPLPRRKQGIWLLVVFFGRKA